MASRDVHVVIVGGGFGGLCCVRALRHPRVRITIIDRQNHHLFQPLLYQVAIAGLSPAEIAMPIRSIVRRRDDVDVVLGEVARVDPERRCVVLADSSEVPFDYLVLAAGATTSYFGNDAWSSLAPGLKSLDDAVEIRNRVLLAFEAAERARDPELVRRLLTFVVIGAGPTGVELAGAIAELANVVLARDFRHISPPSTRVVLVEGGERVLPSFSPDLSAKAAAHLRSLGVEVRVGARVAALDARSVTLGNERLEAETVLWAAGVRASPLAATLGAELDRLGRVIVQPDCSVGPDAAIFAIGDLAHFRGEDGAPLPGVSPVAMQQGRYVARAIVARLEARPLAPFRYVDKGSMATIGRSRAIAQLGGLALHGFVAWVAWLLVHIVYLIGFRNRFVVLFSWFWSYVMYRRGARLITRGRLPDRDDLGL